MNSMVTAKWRRMQPEKEVLNDGSQRVRFVSPSANCVCLVNIRAFKAVRSFSGDHHYFANWSGNMHYLRASQA